MNARLSLVSACVIGAVVAGAVALGNASASSPTRPTGSSAPTVSLAPTATTGSVAAGHAFPVNAEGQTYGSAAGLSPNELPDSILVRADNGRFGYILRSDFLGPRLTREQVESFPTDAQGNYVSPGRVVRVFAKDGATQIGVFTVQGDQERPPPGYPATAVPAPGSSGTAST
jgi:hypothetical protein